MLTNRFTRAPSGVSRGLGGVSMAARPQYFGSIPRSTPARVTGGSTTGMSHEHDMSVVSRGGIGTSHDHDALMTTLRAIVNGERMVLTYGWFVRVGGFDFITR
jgi:hypothetical protein